MCCARSVQSGLVGKKGKRVGKDGSRVSGSRGTGGGFSGGVGGRMGGEKGGKRRIGFKRTVRFEMFVHVCVIVFKNVYTHVFTHLHVHMHMRNICICNFVLCVRKPSKQILVYGHQCTYTCCALVLHLGKIIFLFVHICMVNILRRACVQPGRACVNVYMHVCKNTFTHPYAFYVHPCMCVDMHTWMHAWHTGLSQQKHVSPRT
jgi:hypothetical protein